MNTASAPSSAALSSTSFPSTVFFGHPIGMTSTVIPLTPDSAFCSSSEPARNSCMPAGWLGRPAMITMRLLRACVSIVVVVAAAAATTSAKAAMHLKDISTNPLELRNLDLLAVVQRALVRADPHHRPVDRRFGVRHRRPLAEAGEQEVVDQVRVRPAVAAALEERQVVRVLDRRRLREAADRLRQQARVIRHRDPLRDVRLAQRRCGGALRVDHRLLALDLLPLE